MFKPMPYKTGLTRPIMNNMKFAGNIKAAEDTVPQVYQQVTQQATKAKHSLERIKKRF